MSTPAQILDEALAAAKSAALADIAKRPDSWYPCGFAWVVIKPARGPFVSYLKKEANFGSNGTYGGWHIFNPSNVNTQRMEAKFEGALAFAEVLNKYGIKCTAESRMD